MSISDLFTIVKTFVVFGIAGEAAVVAIGVLLIVIAEAKKKQR